MLPKLVGVESFGLFSAGVLLVSRLAIFPDAIGSAFYPLIAKSIRTDRRLAQRHVIFALAAGLGICLAVAIPTAAMAGFIAGVLFPKKPAGCEHVIAVTIWALLLVGIGTTMSYPLNAAGKEAAQARLTLVASIVSMVVGIFVVLHWKLEGACWIVAVKAAVQILFMAPIFLSTFFGRLPSADASPGTIGRSDMGLPPRPDAPLADACLPVDIAGK
jgi:O-antigen/teichoic acid export membrane protein